MDSGMTTSLTRAILLATLSLSPLLSISASAQPALQKMIEGAKRQVGVTRSYDPAYRRIPYPNGDVPRETGVCTDVVIRAYRHAGADLQRLVHEDMKTSFSVYPKNWGLRRPDTNIDHRRVPNLATFFRRKGQALPVTRRGADYRPGDIITWRLSSGVPHIGVISDVAVRGTDRHLVVHNIGAGAQIEDVLFGYALTGHYRYGR
ncbi:MAG TPA: DUF1287 domain-containing protein [Thermoanaerobaculia bacterium]|nr:DUF1287 domain-containing protein [Thermoanaerobaculia bacterium]